MTNPPPDSQQDEREAFLSAGERERSSGLGEMVHMVRSTRKWWMLPLILVIVVLGLALLITSTGAGPLLYTIF